MGPYQSDASGWSHETASNPEASAIPKASEHENIRHLIETN